MSNTAIRRTPWMNRENRPCDSCARESTTEVGTDIASGHDSLASVVLPGLPGSSCRGAIQFLSVIEKRHASWSAHGCWRDEATAHEYDQCIHAWERIRAQAAHR